MILMAIVGLGIVIGMPYLLDNSTAPPLPFSSSWVWLIVACAVDPEMRAEFEEQQKRSVLSGGASATNPLQNFDMAAWMAGKTTGSGSGDKEVVEAVEEKVGGRGGGGSGARKRRG